MDAADLSSLLQKRAVGSSCLSELAELFSTMDAGYDAIVARYGFACDGCEENCCYTRFYHHTLAEALTVYEGFRQLPREDRIRMQAAARAVVGADPDARPMCPANHDGRCGIYAHRPMICRLHGPASEMRHPSAGVKRFPGCQAFHDHCGDTAQSAYHSFDRTPYYRQMAEIERRFQQRLGMAVKPRMTVAEMIAAFPLDDPVDAPKEIG